MAWYEPRRRMGVYYPRPLNWLLRAVREFIYRVQLAVHAPRLECAQVFDMQRLHRERERLAVEYARGYVTGWRECFHACLDVVEDEIAGAQGVYEAYDVAGWLAAGPEPGKEN